MYDLGHFHNYKEEVRNTATNSVALRIKRGFIFFPAQ